MLNTALIIAAQAHQGQKDLGGADYILHPLRVMAAVNSTDEKIVALLHDVIEDHPEFEETVAEANFKSEIYPALMAITKRKGEKYQDYIKRVSNDRIARAVKIADLLDNMDITRLFTLTTRGYKRLAKYREAWAYLVTC